MPFKTHTIKFLIIFYYLSTLYGCAPKTELFASTHETHQRQDTVIVLHGMLRTANAMVKLSERLAEKGYLVYNKSYPAREKPIFEIVDDLHQRLKRCCLSRLGKLHFVTHSMGGIVARAYIDKYPPENLGRVVMLSPPNKGTELADTFKDNKLFGLVFGPAIQELGTDDESTPNKLGKANYELGVITGNLSWNPVTSLIIPGADDGTVSVARAQLDGMHDFKVVPNTHTFIMSDGDVIDEVIYFLEQGQFNDPELFKK